MGNPLNPDFKYEMVFAYRCLGAKQKAIAEMTGKAQTTISHSLRLTPRNQILSPEAHQAKLAKTREWLRANPEKRKDSYKRHNKKRYETAEYKAYCLSANKKRKAKMQGQPNCSAVDAIYLLAYNLTKATGIQYVVDHIQPLCANGEHAAYNLQVIPYDQNATKSGKWGVAEQTYFCNGLFD